MGKRSVQQRWIIVISTLGCFDKAQSGFLQFCESFYCGARMARLLAK